MPTTEPPVSKPAPVPVQLVAFALDQLRSLAPPSAMTFGIAVSVAATGAVTITVTLWVWLVEPPGPVQISWYSVVVVGVTGALPLGAPAVVKPTPLQLVASVLDQLRSLVPPLAIVVRLALRVAVGAGITVTDVAIGALVAPPAPRQSSW